MDEKMLHLDLTVLTPEMTQLCLIYILRSVTSLLYSHRFGSIQILNSQVHVLCLPPPFGLFLCVQ